MWTADRPSGSLVMQMAGTNNQLCLRAHGHLTVTRQVGHDVRARSGVHCAFVVLERAVSLRACTATASVSQQTKQLMQSSLDTQTVIVESSQQLMN